LLRKLMKSSQRARERVEHACMAYAERSAWWRVEAEDKSK
jgi:hypothetical protein